MKKLPKRKNIRLKGYDYSQAGYYYVTICTKNRQNLFWNEWDVRTTCDVQLSTVGKIVDLEINKINFIYENVEINKYVIMPNHIHMIIILNDRDRRPKVAPTISRIIKQFKGSISKQIGFSLWQKSFYDHIIRNKHEYERIYGYIETNPLKWEEDKYYV